MAQTKIGAMKLAAQNAGLSFEQFKLLVDSGQKRCTRCKTWKQVSAFGKDKTRGDGIDSTCFFCRRVKIRVDRHKIPPAFKGHHHSPESKAKISAALKGKRSRLGKRLSEETKCRMSEYRRQHYPRGKYHYAWKNGASQRLLDGRRDPRYQDWRKAVFKRDGFKCQKCGDDRGGNLRAHHIKPFSKFPDLRFEVSNGITLCHQCHELEHFKPDSIRNVRKLKRGERLWK
ncbi:MAG: HNH endonuclease [Patescibacteria group bacterium]|nr:HNH endonuclease [Patescibacteria group bacterium]